MGPFFIIYQLLDTKDWTVCIDREGQLRLFDSSLEADRAGKELVHDLSRHGVPARFFVSRIHQPKINPIT